MTTSRKRKSRKPKSESVFCDATTDELLECQAELLPAPVKKDVSLPEIKPQYKTARVKPNPDLISINQYWQDIKNRSEIHNYEFAEAMDELRNAVKWTNEKLDKLCDRVKEVAP